MKHKGLRIALIVIEAFIGLSAIGGGIALLIGAFDQWLPVAWLQGHHPRAGHLGHCGAVCE
jgi:hypothetical protein